MDAVELRDKLGICLDTCHVFDAGYDIVGNLGAVLEEFDRHIGLDCLKVIHLNDSLNPHASHKDRHAKIGQGSIASRLWSASSITLGSATCLLFLKRPMIWPVMLKKYVF